MDDFSRKFNWLLWYFKFLGVVSVHHVVNGQTVYHGWNADPRTREGSLRRGARVVVYGSRARGDFDPSSDLDVLVVLNECNPAVLELARAARYEVMQR